MLNIVLSKEAISAWYSIGDERAHRLYDNHVGLVCGTTRCIRHDIDKESVFLTKVKERYTQLLPNYPVLKSLKVFLDSVYCQLFHHRGLIKNFIRFFITNLRAYRFAQAPRPYQERLLYKGDLPALLQDILSRLPLRLPWQNKSR